MSRQKTHDRSGREAGAVRDRSDRALLAAWSSAAQLSRQSLFVSLTPARWRDHEFGWRIPGFAWVRGLVLWGTAREPLGNVQSVDIVGLFAWFRQFSDFGGGYVYARAHAQARVYVRGGNQGTREPQDYISRNQVDSGSLSGSLAVPQRTAVLCLVRVPSERNILGGGNVAGLLGLVAIGAAGVQIWGEAAKVSGFSGRSAATRASSSTADRQQLGEIRPIGRNGGNPPFSRGRSGHVGSSMLEGWPETLQFQHFGCGEHQPSRLARADLVQLAGRPLPPASIAQGGRAGPPLPHSRRCRSLAPWRASVPEFGSSSGPAACRRRPECFPASRGKPAGGREGWSGSTGSGWRVGRWEAGKPAVGRGSAVRPACREGVALRRTIEASGRVAHVN